MAHCHAAHLSWRDVYPLKSILQHFVSQVFTIVVVNRMALRIKSEGSLKSTRHWSCSTLRDGVDQLVCESRECEQQEEDLLKMIEDWYIETGVTLDS